MPLSFLLGLPGLQRVALIGAVVASIGLAVLWLRYDAASDALAERDAETNKEILDAIDRSSERPLLPRDTCFERLLDGEPCI